MASEHSMEWNDAELDDDVVMLIEVDGDDDDADVVRQMQRQNGAVAAPESDRKLRSPSVECLFDLPTVLGRRQNRRSLAHHSPLMQQHQQQQHEAPQPASSSRYCPDRRRDSTRWDENYTHQGGPQPSSSSRPGRHRRSTRRGGRHSTEQLSPCPAPQSALTRRRPTRWDRHGSERQQYCRSESRSISPIRAMPPQRLHIEVMAPRAEFMQQIAASPFDLSKCCDNRNTAHAQCSTDTAGSSITHAIANCWARRQERKVLQNDVAGTFASTRSQHSDDAYNWAQLLSSILTPRQALAELLQNYVRYSRRSDDRDCFVTYGDVDSACSLLLRKCRLMKEWLYAPSSRHHRLEFGVAACDNSPEMEQLKRHLLSVLHKKREEHHFSEGFSILRKRIVFIGGDIARTIYAEQYRWGYVHPDHLLCDTARLHFSHSVDYVVLTDDVEEQHAQLATVLQNWPVHVLLVSNPERLDADAVIKRLNCELGFDLTAARLHGSKAERRKQRQQQP